jgi:GTP-binding protein
LHFFRTDAGFTLVDLPGYGFAQGDPKERIAWKALIESYITARPQLRAVVVLVDSRHEPSREDRGIFDWLNALQKNALCVATKADKLSGNEKVRAAAMLKRSLKLNHEPILFSAINGLGREALVVKLKALTQS